MGTPLAQCAVCCTASAAACSLSASSLVRQSERQTLVASEVIGLARCIPGAAAHVRVRALRKVGSHQMPVPVRRFDRFGFLSLPGAYKCEQLKTQKRLRSLKTPTDDSHADLDRAELSSCTVCSRYTAVFVRAMQDSHLKVQQDTPRSQPFPAPIQRRLQSSQ